MWSETFVSAAFAASEIASVFAVPIAVACAVETGLSTSAVLFTFVRPTESFVSAATAFEIFVSAAFPAAVTASASAVST